MNKILMLLIKYINHYTNSKLTPETEAKSILKYLLLKSSTKHSTEVFDALESQFHEILREREMYHEKEYKLINSYLPKYSDIMKIVVKDPVLHEPIKH